MSETLNAKQEAFVAEYLKCKNQTQAYIAAYQPKSEKAAEANAARLIRNDKIAKRIAEALTRVAKDSEETVAKQLRLLGEIRERCMQAEPVLDDQGDPTGEYKFDSRGALKAIELIGKHLGMWEKRKEDDAEDPRNVTPISPSDRIKILDTIIGKRRKDAIQVPPASKVPIQPTPVDRKEMGGGNAELPDFAGGQVPNP